MFSRILHCAILPCAVALFGLFMVVSSFEPPAFAQEERPEITPGERKPARKKDAGPRALGIVQLGKDGKASIVPVAILVGGKFWDAGAYKADPVPMALDTGTVYEGERSGSSLGLFTVGSALHSNNPAAAIPWLGTGVWRANGTEPPAEGKKAESAPAGISLDEGPPRLTRAPNATKPAPAAQPASNAPSASSSKPASSSGDEPPRLTKPSSPTPDSGSTREGPSTGKPSGDPKPKDSKSADNGKSGDQAKKQGANIPASDSGASEANRPKLRRGKPAESFADEEIPGYSLPGARPAKDASGGKVVETVAANKDVQLVPAISDAGGPTPKSFAFDWIPGEEEDRRKQMVELAKEQVRAYVGARSKNEIPATSARPSTKRAVSPKLPEPVLENMQMVAYDLWNSNQPVLILSAQAHMPAPGNGIATDSDVMYFVMLVAYPDIYHNLRKIFVSITDKFHLDMTPKLELIDAVDADGDGRGELLFRETSDAGAGWVVYRASADKLWKLFDSLNPI